jgi:hypothetical protein
MIAVSDRWPVAVTASHRVAHQVQVWRGGQLLVADLPVSGGTVVRDHGAAITSSADVEVADPAFLPAVAQDPLMPLGSELRILLGIRYADATVELVQVFAGPVVATPTAPTATAGFTVRAEGWLRYVADDRFLAPYAPTGSAAAAITALLRESVPGAVVEVAVPDRAVPTGLLFEEDRLQAVHDLAAGLGAVVRERRDGGFRIAADDPPDPAAVPVREFVHGQRNTMLSRTEPELTRDERYNAVVAFNPHDDTVRALARIEDPASPVRWGGPFGRKVLFYSSPLLTAATVQAAAATRLDGLRGRIRKIDADIGPDPSLEPGDHVRIVWPPSHRGAAAVQEVAQVRRVEHPIGPGAARLELRGTG